MTTFLWENVHMVPGQTAEYMRMFSERWLALSDKYDRDLYAVSGFFVPDVLNTSHPAVRILWTLGSWETWGARHSRGTPEEKLIKTFEFFNPALTTRTGWTDKMFQSLPCSPATPVRPASASPGSVVLAHRFVVPPSACDAFVETFEHDVMPASASAGLELQLFGRAIGHPTEYLAIWTLGAGDAYVAYRSSFDAAVPHGILPGFEKAWQLVSDVEEEEMSPAWFSPIGGTQHNPAGPTEEQISI